MFFVGPGIELDAFPRVDDLVARYVGCYLQRNFGLIQTADFSAFRMFLD